MLVRDRTLHFHGPQVVRPAKPAMACSVRRYSSAFSLLVIFVILFSQASSIKDAEDPVEISSEDGDGDDDEEADPVRRASPRKGVQALTEECCLKQCGQPCGFDD